MDCYLTAGVGVDIKLPLSSMGTVVSSSHVHSIHIWGPSRTGKTTIAKTFYESDNTQVVTRFPAEYKDLNVDTKINPDARPQYWVFDEPDIEVLNSEEFAKLLLEPTCYRVIIITQYDYHVPRRLRQCINRTIHIN